MNSMKSSRKIARKKDNVIKRNPKISARVISENLRPTPMKVSVVIPVYNCGEFIEECLNSILAQTISDIEIICVNDQSTDNSLEVLNNCARKDSRIIVHTLSENSGAGIARNTGISFAHGEFIAFMDADDSYPSDDVLEYLYQTAKENNVLICGGCFSSLKRGEIVAEYGGLNQGYVFEQCGLVKFSDYQFEFGYQRFIFDRKLLIDNQIEFPNYRRFQDPPFLVKAMIKAGVFYAVTKVTYLYREAYKEIVWTPEKAMDLLQGVTDVLNLSSENNLCDLHYRIFKRLCGYSTTLIAEYRKDPEYCLPYLIKANRAINIPFVKIYDKSVDEHYVFPALDIATHTPLKPIQETRPKVSVIIPIYNVEKYIIECVASVVNQTLKDIEIICVDDGSPDNSIELIEEEFGGDKRIKIIRKKNGGLSSARNAGVRVATGEYLYFLDSDDYIENDAMEICYKEAKENNLDLLDFNAEAFDEEQNSDDMDIAHKERKVQEFINYYDRKGDYSEVVDGQMLYTRMHRNNEVRSMTQLHFIRHDFYLENSLNFYDGILHEDHLFTTRCMFLAKRAKHIPEKLYHRRVRIGSIMTTKEGVKNLKGYFITYCETLRFLITTGDKFYPISRKALINEMNSYLRNTRRISKLVGEEELNQFISELSDFEKIIYDYVTVVNKVEKCINDLNGVSLRIQEKFNEIIKGYNKINSENKLELLSVVQSGQPIPETVKKTAIANVTVGSIIVKLFNCIRVRGIRYTMIRIFRGKDRANEYINKKSRRK